MSNDNKEGAGVPETWQHVANEWADMATSGIQAVRNIIDGIETPEAVLANMNFCYSHCAEVQSRAKATPPAGMPAAPSDAIDARRYRWLKAHGYYAHADDEADIDRGLAACALTQCPNCKGTRAPSPLDPDWRGRCECAAPGAAIAAREQEAPRTLRGEVWDDNPDGIVPGQERGPRMNPDTGFWEGAEADEEDMLADEAIAAGHTPGDSVPGVSTRGLVQAQARRSKALASREEAPAAPAGSTV